MNAPPWLQQQSYAGQANDQVDWAELAKQWIAMKSVQPDVVPEQSTNNGDRSYGVGDAKTADASDAVDAHDWTAGTDQDPASYYSPWPVTGSSPWPIVGSGGTYADYSSYDQYYGSASGHHGSADESSQDGGAVFPHEGLPTSSTSFWSSTSAGLAGMGHGASTFPGWSAGHSGNSHPDDRRRDGGARSRDRDRDRRRSRASPPHPVLQPPVAAAAPAIFDRRQRKLLPAWIREGLEKMEREKKRKEEEEEARKSKANGAEKSAASDPQDPAKSKFDSESETEPEPEVSTDGGGRETSRSRSPSKSPPPSDEPGGRAAAAAASPETGEDGLEPELSLDERRSDLLILLRRLLTEMLMQVSTTEIEEVCRSTVAYFNKKAPARLLKKSNALAALSQLGADEEDSSAPANEDNESDVSSDEKSEPEERENRAEDHGNRKSEKGLSNLKAKERSPSPSPPPKAKSPPARYAQRVNRDSDSDSPPPPSSSTSRRHHHKKESKTKKRHRHRRSSSPDSPVKSSSGGGKKRKSSRDRRDRSRDRSDRVDRERKRRKRSDDSPDSSRKTSSKKSSKEKRSRKRRSSRSPKRTKRTRSTSSSDSD